MLARRMLSAVGGGADTWYSGAYAAWQAKGAASLATSYLDLTGNGRNLTAGVAPTWDAVNGWISTGDKWLNTNIVSNKEWTAIIRAVNNDPNPSDGTASQLFGKVDTNARFFVWGSYSGSLFAQWGNATFYNSAPYFTSGVVAMAANNLYVDGVQLTPTGSPTYTGTDVSPILVMAGGGLPSFTGSVQAFGIWNTTLDAATVATKSAQMAAL